MNKPIQLSLRQRLVRKVMVDTAHDESTVDAVISHQFQSVIKAFENYQSVEITGFGRFTYIAKRARIKMEESEKCLERLYEELKDNKITEYRKYKIGIRVRTLTEFNQVVKQKLGIV